MYEYNEHSNVDTNHNMNSSKIDRKFLDSLYESIHSVEFEMDIMSPRSASLRFLSNHKIIDYVVSQKLSKNIVVKMICTVDEGNELIRQLLASARYKSIKLSLPKTTVNSLFFIKDKHDILEEICQSLLTHAC